MTPNKQQKHPSQHRLRGVLLYYRGLTRRRDGLVQLGTGRDAVIYHEQMQKMEPVESE